MAVPADDSEPFSLVLEACDSYEARSLPDGRTEVRIVIPPRFADLWLAKLSELRGTLAEVQSLAGRAPDAEPGAAADPARTFVSGSS